MKKTLGFSLGLLLLSSSLAASGQRQPAGIRSVVVSADLSPGKIVITIEATGEHPNQKLHSVSARVDGVSVAMPAESLSADFAINPAALEIDSDSGVSADLLPEGTAKLVGFSIAGFDRHEFIAWFLDGAKVAYWMRHSASPGGEQRVSGYGCPTNEFVSVCERLAERASEER